MAERKSWKAWGVLNEFGDLVCTRLTRERAKNAVSTYLGFRIVRVTITVDETKKKKGKVGRG